MANDGNVPLQAVLPKELVEDPSCAQALAAILVADGRIAVSILEPDGTFLFVSPAVRELLGWTTQDPVGKRLNEMLPGPEGEERMDVVRRVLADGRPVAVREEFQGIPARTLVRRVNRPSKGPLVIAVHLMGGACAAVDCAGGFDVYEPKNARISVLTQLSATELSVLRLIAQGLTGEQVAKAIHRTVKTVEWHRARLGRKLGLKTRVELARFAIRAGLVDLESHAVPGDAPAARD